MIGYKCKNLDEMLDKVNILNTVFNNSNKAYQDFNSKYALNDNAYKTLIKLQDEK
ncbi:MAG: hypothetical protein L6U99_01220 [Clostridium sp.]|nr:MAG: hypothetical protein L6U99_01220 [Clostridium sp.]